MLLNQLKNLRNYLKFGQVYFQRRLLTSSQILLNTKTQEIPSPSSPSTRTCVESLKRPDDGPLSSEIFPTTSSRVVPMVLAERDPVVLPFDEVPGPGSLKYLAKARKYITGIGTQLTASAITLGFEIGAYVTNKKSNHVMSSLFDKYGPVVHFVSPIGGDIVLINQPDHIQKVFASEGNQPLRSTLDSLERFRVEYRNSIHSGLYNFQGEDWYRRRNLVAEPLKNIVMQHMDGIEDVCHNFVNKVYNTRDVHDELKKDLYSELHKWAFDAMGYLIFSKKFTMTDTEIVYSQCDMSWLYHSLERSSNAIMKCESGLQMWKILPTPAWKSLVKHCESLDNLIGKHVVEAQQKIHIYDKKPDLKGESLISGLLMSDENLSAEDITTLLMDMLLIGVNTISSSMSFLVYHLAKYQKVQKTLWQEIEKANNESWFDDVANVTTKTPYLQACIRETLRMVPPIPKLSRVLPKNIILDKYNIPRGTLIIMSMQDAALKESNFDDALRFNPERWLKPGANEYHAFASIPFGFGARKCMGQNIAEVMMSMLTRMLLQKFKLEYHYGDIYPTRSFIVKPHKPLKIRFVDRM